MQGIRHTNSETGSLVHTTIILMASHPSARTREVKKWGQKLASFNADAEAACELSGELACDHM